MIYATRHGMLWEFNSLAKLNAENRSIGDTTAQLNQKPEYFKRVDGQTAHKWIKQGYVHNTGLYVEGNKVRYAGAME